MVSLRNVPFFLKNYCKSLVQIVYMLILMKCLLDLVFHDIFPVVGCLLQAYQLFLIVHQQVSGFNLASKISISIFLSDSQNPSWVSSFFLFVVFGFVGCCFFKQFWFLQVRKALRVGLFLNIWVCSLLFSYIFFGA